MSDPLRLNDPDYTWCMVRGRKLPKYHVHKTLGGQLARAKVLITQNMVRVLGEDYTLFSPRPRDYSLEAKDIGLIHHSLGLMDGSRWSHRNWFVVDVSEGTPARICRLIDAGMLTPGKLMAGMQSFHVTNKGIRTAGVNNRVKNEDRVK